MGKIVVSKNGKDFYELPDTEEQQAGAEAKGYKRYLDVTKNGKDVFTIPADDNVEKAFAKGYKTTDEFNFTKDKSLATRTKEGIDDTIRGISQGATLGLGDEILGRVQGAYDTAANGGSFSDNYQKNRDAKRQEYKDAQDRSPAAYTLGEIGGNLLTGMGAGAAASTTLMGNAALGAIQGYGNSNKEFGSNDLALDTLKGAGAGAAGYVAGDLLGKGVRGVKNWLGSGEAAQKVAAVTASTVGDVPSEVGLKIINRPELANIKPKGNLELTDGVVRETNKLKQEVNDLSGKAWEELQKTDARFAPIAEKTKTNSIFDLQIGGRRLRDDFQGISQEVASEMNISGSNQGAQKKALSALANAEKDLTNAQNWSDIKTIIQNIDDNIDWNNVDKSVSNEALSRFRTQLDEILKLNSSYAEAMIPVSKKAEQLSKLQSSFRLKKGRDGLLESTDSSIGASRNLINDMQKEAKPLMKQNLENVSPELLDDFDVASIYTKTRGDTGVGLRGIRDKYGRELATKALAKTSGVTKGTDKALSAAATWIDGNWDKLSEPVKKLLTDAADRGPAALVSTWYVISNNQKD